MHPGLYLVTLFIHSITHHFPSHSFLFVLILLVKGAGGKPSLLAPVEKVTFLEYAWPEFTMGEYISKIASIKRDFQENVGFPVAQSE